MDPDASSMSPDGGEVEQPLRIRARGLGKTYRLYDRPWHRLVEQLGGRTRHRTHRALDELDFDLRAGETLGVVGQNGAGKSTLLKILAGVAEPSRGSLEVQGTVSAILELGAGFHPEFSGYQNIRINAAMLGLDERRLAERLPAIIDFCELGDFLHQPVKVYSSGMSMRLAFAIATQVEPDVLIIDEALSVGDGYFQKKCMDRILELIEGGTSLLFCSHAMYYVSTLCQRVLWLRDGEVAAYGDTDDVVQRYEEYLLAQQAPETGREKSAEPAPSEGMVAGRAPATGVSVQPARITDLQLHCEGREILPEDGLRAGQTLSVEVTWVSQARELAFQAGIGVNRLDGVEVFSLDTRALEHEITGRDRYTVRFVIPNQPLLRGQFTVHAFVLDERALHVYDHRVLHDAFRIAQSPGYAFGILRVPARIELLESKE